MKGGRGEGGILSSVLNLKNFAFKFARWRYTRFRIRFAPRAKRPWYFRTLHIRRGMPKTAVDLPSVSFASFGVVQGSFTPVSPSLDRFFFLSFFFPSFFSYDTKIEPWKNTTFRIHNANRIRVTRERAWPKDSTKVVEYRCAYQRARFLCPVATTTKILYISKRRNNRLRISPRRKLEKLKIVRREYRECGFLTFSPVRRLFVSRIERQSFEAFENLFESYRTILHLALLSQYHGGREGRGEENRKKRRKKSPVSIRTSRPFFFSSFFNENVEPFPFVARSDSSRKRGGCDHVFPQTECEHARSHNSFLCNRLHRSPPPPHWKTTISRYKRGDGGRHVFFHHRGHPLSRGEGP